MKNSNLAGGAPRVGTGTVGFMTLEIRAVAEFRDYTFCTFISKCRPLEMGFDDESFIDKKKKQKKN